MFTQGSFKKHISGRSISHLKEGTSPQGSGYKRINSKIRKMGTQCVAIFSPTYMHIRFWRSCSCSILSLRWRRRRSDTRQSTPPHPAGRSPRWPPRTSRRSPDPRGPISWRGRPRGSCTRSGPGGRGPRGSGSPPDGTCRRRRPRAPPGRRVRRSRWSRRGSAGGGLGRGTGPRLSSFSWESLKMKERNTF